MTAKEFLKTLLRGAYAWPGGYPLHFVTTDGACLSYASAFECRAEIVSALVSGDKRSGWYVCAADVNWEDPDLFCDHSGKRIESAYTEDTAGAYDKLPSAYQAWRERIKGQG